MSGQQLGKRLGVSKMRVAALEQAEASGATTLKTLRRTAEAMDCVLVYALAPKTSLKDTLHRQAHLKAALAMTPAQRLAMAEELLESARLAEASRAQAAEKAR